MLPSLQNQPTLAIKKVKGEGDKWDGPDSYGQVDRKQGRAPDGISGASFSQADDENAHVHPQVALWHAPQPASFQNVVIAASAHESHNLLPTGLNLTDDSANAADKASGSATLSSTQMDTPWLQAVQDTQAELKASQPGQQERNGPQSQPRTVVHLGPSMSLEDFAYSLASGTGLVGCKDAVALHGPMQSPVFGVSNAISASPPAVNPEVSGGDAEQTRTSHLNRATGQPGVNAGLESNAAPEPDNGDGVHELSGCVIVEQTAVQHPDCQGPGRAMDPEDTLLPLDAAHMTTADAPVPSAAWLELQRPAKSPAKKKRQRQQGANPGDPVPPRPMDQDSGHNLVATAWPSSVAQPQPRVPRRKRLRRQGPAGPMAYTDGPMPMYPWPITHQYGQPDVGNWAGMHPLGPGVHSPMSAGPVRQWVAIAPRNQPKHLAPAPPAERLHSTDPLVQEGRLGEAWLAHRCCRPGAPGAPGKTSPVLSGRAGEARATLEGCMVQMASMARVQAGGSGREADVAVQACIADLADVALAGLCVAGHAGVAALLETDPRLQGAVQGLLASLSRLVYGSTFRMEDSQEMSGSDEEEVVPPQWGDVPAAHRQGPGQQPGRRSPAVRSAGGGWATASGDSAEQRQQVLLVSQPRQQPMASAHTHRATRVGGQRHPSPPHVQPVYVIGLPPQGYNPATLPVPQQAMPPPPQRLPMHLPHGHHGMREMAAEYSAMAPRGHQSYRAVPLEQEPDSPNGLASSGGQQERLPTKPVAAPLYIEHVLYSPMRLDGEGTGRETRPQQVLLQMPAVATSRQPIKELRLDAAEGGSDSSPSAPQQYYDHGHRHGQEWQPQRFQQPGLQAVQRYQGSQALGAEAQQALLQLLTQHRAPPHQAQGPGLHGLDPVKAAEPREMMWVPARAVMHRQ